ncbi:hypothetical protein BT96DRAFT_999358 [Gymnopus androsaceus JB14]|uniref:DUF6589 domain-containing protein n=1 Tax=Gymnopus androsaceus JB14 TaxID=1447944 RepID=A0A6A4H758_9AGAR|nr:hypothetical protein BT96DRAFT_999358 [Gymnopus androsaceus JB14]
MRNLTHDPRVPDEFSAQVPVRIAATANERTKAKGVCTVTKEDLMSFRLAERAKLFQKRAPLVWYLTQCMAAPKKNGKLVDHKHRSPELIQTAVISSFALSQNQYANGYMAIQLMGVWHIACGSHVDEFLRVWEGGIGLENRMICGCTCTMIGLEDCAPDAFDAEDCLACILKNERPGLTVSQLWNDINWEHICGVQTLHVLRALLSYCPLLNFMEKLVSEAFRTKYAIHCMRAGWKTKVVPLGCNSEHEIETAGMLHALHNFFSQAGVSPDLASSLLAWVTGDGGSLLAIDNAKKYLAAMYDPEDPESDYKNLHHVIPTLGIWHTQSTMQNTIAGNHYGPLATDVPSALSQSAACTGFKHPTNFKDCGNYYPLQQSMTAVWETQIIDCWRQVLIELSLDNYKKVVPHFEDLARDSRLPTFEWFLEKAECIVNQYMTPDAYKQALSKELNNSTSNALKFPIGKPFSFSTSRTVTSDSAATENALDEGGDANDGDVEEDEPVEESTTEKKPTAHTEKAGFTGDWVLANLILFKMEYSFWIKAAYAIPEGDIGWVWEILKIWIFVAAGGNNMNYVYLLLEMYCLFRYESSKNLRDAIWNNWLVNVTGELGKNIPDDLLQEHYNQWIEDIVKKCGKNFDDKFLRNAISPNSEWQYCKPWITKEKQQNPLDSSTASPSAPSSPSPLPPSDPLQLQSPVPPSLSPIPEPSRTPSPILVDSQTSSSSGTSDEDKKTSEEEARSDDEELLEEISLSRLPFGPELMASIDPSSGRLIYEWDSDAEELDDGNAESGDSSDARDGRDFELDSDSE